MSPLYMQLHLPPSEEYDVAEYAWRPANFGPCKNWIDLARKGREVVKLKLPGDILRWADYDFMRTLENGRGWIERHVSLNTSLIMCNQFCVKLVCDFCPYLSISMLCWLWSPSTLMKRRHCEEIGLISI